MKLITLVCANCGGDVKVKEEDTIPLGKSGKFVKISKGHTYVCVHCGVEFISETDEDYEPYAVSRGEGGVTIGNVHGNMTGNTISGRSITQTIISQDSVMDNVVQNCNAGGSIITGQNNVVIGGGGIHAGKIVADHVVEGTLIVTDGNVVATGDGIAVGGSILGDVVLGKRVFWRG